MIISKTINSLLIVLTMFAFFAQIFIDFTTVNIATCMIILLSTFITVFYLRWTNSIQTHPLSSFAILGLCLTTSTGALWAQSLLWTSVIENLRQPIVTLTWLTIFQVTSIIAHFAYRGLYKTSYDKKQSLLRQLFIKMGIYEVPEISVMWWSGFFGLFCLFLSGLFPLARGLAFIAFIPFLIPIYYSQYGEAFCNIKRNIFYLVIHFAFIFLICLLFNARGTLFLAFVTVGIVLTLFAMKSRIILTSTILFRVVIAILVALSIAIPASNITTAMAIARADRGKVSPIKVFTKTIENFNNPQKLEAYRISEDFGTKYLIYNEYYISHPLLGRFVNTQRHDSQIYFAGLINDHFSNELLRKSFDYLWIVLPQPLLDLLKIDIDKRYFVVSMGDQMAHYAVGTTLGGLRTGSVFAQLLLFFGGFAVMIYFFMCLILFASMDIFSKRSPDGIAIVSTLGMLNLWTYFNSGIVADSFNQLFIGIVRGVFQPAVLYFIVIFVVKFFIKMFDAKSHLRPSSDLKYK